MDKMNLLAKASGSDIANLWMNFAKLLFVAGVSYHGVLYEQLGVNIFGREPFMVLSATQVEPGGSQQEAIRDITSDNPKFDISILPLAVHRRYRTVEIEIAKVWRTSANATRELVPLPPLDEETKRFRLQSFLWPTEASRPPYKVTFDLKTIVGADQFGSGKYDVEYVTRFTDERNVVTQIPDGLAGESANNIVRLSYSPVVEVFGDVVTVQGRPSRLPEELSDKQNCRFIGGILDGRSCSEGEVRLGVPYVNSPYRESGSYRNASGRETNFTVNFIVLRNQPPRSVQSQPDLLILSSDQLINFQEGDKTLFKYFSLSSIVDPDREDSGLRVAGLRITAVLELPGDVTRPCEANPMQAASPAGFTIPAARDGDYWLQVDGGIDGINRVLPNSGDARLVLLEAKDETGSPQRIKVCVFKK